MSRIIVEYNPPISVKTQYLIKNEITPSMISNDETSGQYDISMVKEMLQETLEGLIEQKMEDFGLPNDIKIVDELIELGVDYIEI